MNMFFFSFFDILLINYKFNNIAKLNDHDSINPYLFNTKQQQ